MSWRYIWTIRIFFVSIELSSSVWVNVLPVQFGHKHFITKMFNIGLNAERVFNVWLKGSDCYYHYFGDLNGNYFTHFDEVFVHCPCCNEHERDSAFDVCVCVSVCFFKYIINGIMATTIKAKKYLLMRSLQRFTFARSLPRA